MIREHDLVVLLRDVESARLEPGDIGTVVHVHDRGAGFEVEFMRVDGTTVSVETLDAAEVRPVRPTDMPHARRRRG